MINVRSFPAQLHSQSATADCSILILSYIQYYILHEHEPITIGLYVPGYDTGTVYMCSSTATVTYSSVFPSS